MLKIRLKRTGKRNAPSYRIVVADSRSPRNGKTKEEIGWFNPTEDPNKVVYDEERLKHWIKNGAQMTPAVEKLVEGTYEYEPYTRQNEKEERSTEEEKSETEEPEAQKERKAQAVEQEREPREKEEEDKGETRES
ncbi:MAG: 30S ribosomal protein S16 [Patescibacteria group bacterium]|nr:30S ribosomal protein S16 [Patescibacteria group bacterium]